MWHRMRCCCTSLARCLIRMIVDKPNMEGGWRAFGIHNNHNIQARKKIASNIVFSCYSCEEILLRGAATTPLGKIFKAIKTWDKTLSIIVASNQLSVVCMTHSLFYIFGFYIEIETFDDSKYVQLRGLFFSFFL